MLFVALITCLTILVMASFLWDLVNMKKEKKIYKFMTFSLFLQTLKERENICLMQKWAYMTVILTK